MQKKFFPSTKIQTVLMILIGFIIGSPIAISFLMYEEDVDKAIWGFPMTKALLVSYMAVILIAWFVNRKRKLSETGADLYLFNRNFIKRKEQNEKINPKALVSTDTSLFIYYYY